MELISIVSVSGIGIYIIYQFILFIRSGGRSNCAIGQQQEQQTIMLTEMLEKVNNMETKVDSMETKIGSMETHISKLQSYTVAEDRNIQEKVGTLQSNVDQLENRVRVFETSSLEPKAS